jgi:hypothetical protein
MSDDQLRAQNPWDSLADGYKNLAVLWTRRGGEAVWQDIIRQVIKVREAQLKGDPKNESAAKELFEQYHALGDASKKRGNRAPAKEQYRRAVEWGEKPLTAGTSDRDKELANVCNSLAALEFDDNNYAEAQKYYRRAIDLDEARLAAGQGVTDARVTLALTSYPAMAATCRKLGDVPAAASFAAKGAEQCEVLGKFYYQDRDEAATSLIYWQEDLALRQDVLAAKPDDAGAKKDLAKVYEWLADVNLALGAAVRAEECASLCVKLQQQVADATGHSADSRRSLAFGCLWLATVQLRTGQVAASTDTWDRFLKHRQLLSDEEPNNTAARQSLADAHERVAVARLALGDAAKAAELAHQAAELRQLPEAVRPSPAETRSLALALSTVGDARLELGDLPAARDAYGRARELLEPLVRQTPDESEPRTDLAACLDRLGQVELQAGDFTAATKWFQQADEILGKLDANGNLSRRLDRKLRQDDSTRFEAARKAEALLELPEATLELSQQRAGLLTLRATLLAGRGKVDDAVTTAEALRKQAGEDPERLYEAAVCYALLARAVAAGRPRADLDADRKKSRDLCATRAVKTLQEAVHRGYMDAAYLLNDPDLNGILGEPGYRGVVQALPTPGDRK